MTIAPLDRSISISSSPEAYAGAQRLSELTEAPYVVLLGAPGMGKTVAFEQFAGSTGDTCVSAFRFRPKHLVGITTLFIDALDEIPLANALEIAQSLEDQTTVRWRVSCRAQDWNEGGKLSQAFGKGLAAHDLEPVVAHLQPLSDEEASTVLSTLGCQEPAALLSTLHTLRSTPFALSPLGLHFLLSVQSERLPSLTRFTLYESGARHFATEHNPFKSEDRQGFDLALDRALDHVGRIFLTLLLAGKHGLQRSSPVADTLLSVHDMGLAQADLTMVLDTALFLKKGEEFLPFHRSIQEFLAARYLARLVTGAAGEVRVHFNRAVALLVSNDGLPADGLKALYAWFACHLVNEGAAQHAQVLAQSDPETLLLHGDAATLPVVSRLSILQGVGKRDPYFRWTPEQWGPAQISTVGLVTPDLVPPVTHMLQAETSTHRLSMLLEALSVGPILEGAAEVCWSVALRQSDIQWCREQAIAAWLHNATPEVPEIWMRIDALCVTEEARRGHLRSVAQLFCAIPGEQLTVGELERVLGCLHRLIATPRLTDAPQDGRGVSAYAIRDIAWHVASHLWRPLILEVPKRWRLQAGVGSLEHSFASVVCIAALTSEEVSADEFARMLIATGLITGVDSTFKRAAEEWQVGRPTDEDVFRALLKVMDKDIADSGSFALGLRALGLKASEALVRLLLDTGEFIVRCGGDYVSRQIGIWTLTLGDSAPTWLTPLLRESPSAVAQAALEHVELHEKEEFERQAQQHESVEHWLMRQISHWKWQAPAVAAGELEQALYWGAEIYCGSRPLAGLRGSGTEGLQEVFGGQLAQSVLEGLLGVWTKGICQDDRGGSGAVIAASASMFLESGQNFFGEPVGRMLQVLSATISMRDWRLKERLEANCIARLSQTFIEDPAHFHQLALIRDASWGALMMKLRDHPSASALHAWAVKKSLEQPDTLKGVHLDSVLRLTELNVEPTELRPLLLDILRCRAYQHDNATEAIIGAEADSADRVRWAYFAVCMQPDQFSDNFLKALDGAKDEVIHRIIVDGYPNSGYWRTPGSTLAVSRLLLQFLFRRTPLREGHFDHVWYDTIKVLKAITLSSEPVAEETLLGLLEDARGTRWEDTLKHELELYRRDVRTRTQKLYSPTDLAKVLSSKGPINAQDLKALVSLVLEEIAAELQASPLNMWKLFWDNNQPKIENDCRDVLAGKLRDKLNVFGNIDVAPEAASSGGTRADVLISHGPFSVPIEAKRTSHSHLWYGHSGQLQTYTLSSSTEGQGIYVVFWFGEALPVTSSPAGVKHNSPNALKTALEDLLPPVLAVTTSVFVLDVSDAARAARLRKSEEFDAAKAAKPIRKPRKPKVAAKPPSRIKGAT
ncbi:hypothetical protein [Pseudomonas sp. Irchel 3A5]|uniref:hypothetical protein n=1 Tax=Pseudomonas sp. Irchel 3A5 TaxID=2008911 RepID=UPI000BA3FDDE|nr:hypothetical protein [Pseudomonas sp. Irchel 3A5]